MQIDSMLIEMENTVTNANGVRDLVLDRLMKDGVINEEQHQLYTTSWQVIVIKPSWFKNLLNKFGNKDQSAYIYKFIKLD